MRPIPIAVDLDGTFLLCDTLVRMGQRMLLERPLLIPHAVRRLALGKNHLKTFLWQHSPADVATLPTNAPLLRWLEAQAEAGRPILLVSGAPQGLVDAVAERHSFFSGSLGSNEQRNLTGKRKAALLVDRFGARRFDYAGNSLVDLEVWRHARMAIICNASHRVMKAARREGLPVGTVFPRGADAE